SWDAQVTEKFLREDLAAFQLRCFKRGPDDVPPCRLEDIYNACDQWRLRPNHRQLGAYRISHREHDLRRNARQYALRHLCDAGVPRGRIELRDLRTLHELPCERVFPAPAAYNKDLHSISSPAPHWLD